MRGEREREAPSIEDWGGERERVELTHFPHIHSLPCSGTRHTAAAVTSSESTCSPGATCRASGRWWRQAEARACRSRCGESMNTFHLDVQDLEGGFVLTVSSVPPPSSGHSPMYAFGSARPFPRPNHFLLISPTLQGTTDIGPHYAVTLRAWREAWEQRREEVLALGYSDRFWRKYRSDAVRGMRGRGLEGESGC